MTATSDRSTTFDIEISGGCPLSISDLWPDGNAPENPTAGDVCELIRAYPTSVTRLIADWNLPLTISVGGQEAVWTP